MKSQRKIPIITLCAKLVSAKTTKSEAVAVAKQIRILQSAKVEEEEEDDDDTEEGEDEESKDDTTTDDDDDDDGEDERPAKKKAKPKKDDESKEDKAARKARTFSGVLLTLGEIDACRSSRPPVDPATYAAMKAAIAAKSGGR